MSIVPRPVTSPIAPPVAPAASIAPPAAVEVGNVGEGCHSATRNLACLVFPFLSIVSLRFNKVCCEEGFLFGYKINQCFCNLSLSGVTTHCTRARRPGYICGAGGIQGAFMQFGCSKGSNVLKKSHKSQSSSFIQLRGLGRSFVHSHFTRSTLSFDVYKFFTMRRPHVKLQISYRRVCDLTHNPQARNTQERLTRKCHVFI